MTIQSKSRASFVRSNLGEGPKPQAEVSSQSRGLEHEFEWAHRPRRRRRRRRIPPPLTRPRARNKAIAAVHACRLGSAAASLSRFGRRRRGRAFGS